MSGVRCHLPRVACHPSPVTCHANSQQPKAATTDLPPAKFPAAVRVAQKSTLWTFLRQNFKFWIPFPFITFLRGFFFLLSFFNTCKYGTITLYWRHCDLKTVTVKMSEVCLTHLLLPKLDGVGPVDNRPATNKLHHIVRRKKEEEKNCDMWHVTCDTWHVTGDMRHMTHDTWQMTHDMFGGGEHSLKISAP